MGIESILAARRYEAAKLADPTRYRAIGSVDPAAPPPPPAPTGSAGARPTPFAQTEVGLVFGAETERQALEIQRQNAAALAKQQQADALILQQEEQTFQAGELDRRLAAEAKVRAEERERLRRSNIRQLRAERYTAFGEMMKSGDQVRAVMFALGYGPENDAFDVRAQALGTTVKRLRGALALRATTQAALSRVLGHRVEIGGAGVRALGAPVRAARQFVQGGADIRTLLQSAFGVGSLRAGERPGMSAERLVELIQQVTPTGVV